MIYLIVKFMLSFLLPFIIGLILSYLVQKAARKISERTILSKGSCAAIFVTVTYILVITAVTVIAISAFNMLSGFVSNGENIKSIESILEKLRSSLDGISKNLPEGIAKNSSLIFTQLKDNILTRIVSFVSSLATNIARSLPSFLFGCVVTIVASFYIAKDYEKLLKFLGGMLSKKSVENIVIIRDIIVQNVFGFMKGYLILLTITFAELFVGFLIIGVKKSALLAAVIALVDILPVIGTGTVLLPWSLICMLSDNMSRGVSLLLIYVIITVIRNLIEPKIIGERIGLNPLFMLIIIFVGLRLAGIAGMIILPIALIVVINFYKRQMIDETG